MMIWLIDSDSVSYTLALKDWHEILGHYNNKDILKLEHVVVWPYATMAAAYMRNRCYRVFGSECHAYTRKKPKLDPRCKKGVFLGYYKGSLANLVYTPEISIELKYRIVKFSTKRVGKHLLGDNRDSILLQHDTSPDACSVSGNDSSTKDPCGQAEEPRSGSQVEAGPQTSAESTRNLKKTKETPSIH